MPVMALQQTDRPRWHLLNEARGKDRINIFFAGAGFTYDLAYDAGVRKRLLSWHANSESELEQYINAQSSERQSFGIVDSGAFTVWNKGGTINVREYAEKLLELLLYFDVAANLDVIPGKQGMAAKDITSEMTHEAASAGYLNYSIICGILKANGIDHTRIMPIYHQGESMDWLKKMVDDGATYIGISPSNDYPTPQRALWLDDVFDYLTSLPDLPKTHGYAVTSERLMTDYPWFSVDSASWVHKAGYGSVSTPYGDVTLSDRQSVMGRAESMDGSRWSPEMKEQIAGYFKSIGLDIEDLRKHHEPRWSANAIYLVNWEKQMRYRPKPKACGLFDERPKEIEKGNEQQDCWGLFTGDQKGEVPMSLYDATKPRQ